MSDYATVQANNLKGYKKLTFRIKQVGTYSPTISLLHQSWKTTVSAVRTGVGQYVISIPNSTDVIGGGIKTFSKNRLVQASFSGTQLNINSYELVNPNTDGGQYKDYFSALITIFYRPLTIPRRLKHHGISYFVGFELEHTSFAATPIIKNVYSTFGIAPGVVSECEATGDDVTKSRYLIKGLGSLLSNGFSIGGMSLQKASTNFYFNRVGNDIAIGVSALESLDDNTTWQLSPAIISKAIFFIEFNLVAR